MKDNNRAIAIIPARYASTRLPAKPLADINGKSLIQRVWEAANTSRKLARIIIATDNELILKECLSFGAECIITPEDLPSGTDRIAYTYRELKEDAEIVLNIQGDEPLLHGTTIDKLIDEFSTSKADTGTLIKRINSEEELNDPNVVKVVIDKSNMALYFSRSPVPFVRDKNTIEPLKNYDFWKHIGIYAYRADTLMQFTSTPESPLEQLEKLEQLRLLQDGKSIICVETQDELIGVDTPADLERVREYFA